MLDKITIIEWNYSMKTYCYFSCNITAFINYYLQILTWAIEIPMETFYFSQNRDISFAEDFLKCSWKFCFHIQKFSFPTEKPKLVLMF